MLAYVATVAVLLFSSPSYATQHWFTILPDIGGSVATGPTGGPGCINTQGTSRVPPYARTPGALQQWLQKQGKHPKRGEARDLRGQLHHVAIELPGENFGMMFFSDFSICESVVQRIREIQRDQDRLERRE
jgi:hypothetical protein